MKEKKNLNVMESNEACGEQKTESLRQQYLRELGEGQEDSIDCQKFKMNLNEMEVRTNQQKAQPLAVFFDKSNRLKGGLSNQLPDIR